MSSTEAMNAPVNTITAVTEASVNSLSDEAEATVRLRRIHGRTVRVDEARAADLPEDMRVALLAWLGVSAPEAIAASARVAR